MTRRRATHRGLAESRIYQKRNRFYYYAATPIINPDNGKLSKWHSLCHVQDGIDRARELANRIKKHNHGPSHRGNLPESLHLYLAGTISKRTATAPHDPPRRKMHDQATSEIRRICGVIEQGFADFDVAEVVPSDVAQFVDQWDGQRSAQVYLSRLSDFFRWCCRKGLRSDNPCSQIRVDKPQKRKTYITDEQYHQIRDALLVGQDGRPTRSGVMIQCYVDLCFLLYQRTTEIRLLRWDQMSEDGIHFVPTKTEKSSGATVLVPYSPVVREVLNRAKTAFGENRANSTVESIYVIHSEAGQPYTTHGIGSAWKRACKRAGLSGLTLKDLRAKALTDARKAGYNMEQLRVAAAHTDVEQTEDYIRMRETPESSVQLQLPAKKVV